MCLHVTALFMHTIVIVVVQFITVYSFENPSPKDDLILNISRICLFGSQSVSQTIVIYLFVQFSKPQSLMEERAKSEESDLTDDMDGSQDEKLNMLLYIQSMPKMVKSGVTLHIDNSKSALEQLY